MKKIPALLATIGTIFLLNACTTIDAVKSHDTVREKIAEDYVDILKQIETFDSTPLVKKFNRVYVNQLSKEDVTMPDWFNEEKRTSSVNNIELIKLLQLIFKGVPTNFQFLEGVEKQYLVSMPEMNLTYHDALDYLASLTGYSYAVSGKTIIFKKFEVETFEIRQLPGSESYAVGKKGMRTASATGSDKKVTGDFIGGADQEYTVLNGKLNALSDIKTGVDAILGCFEFEAGEDTESTTDAKVRCNQGAGSKVMVSTSTIMVRAVPSQMREVRDFIAHKNELLTRQVAIQVSFINIDFFDEKQLNVDFDLAASSISKGVKLTASNAAAGILGGLDPRGTLTLESTKGGFNGTKAFLEALSHQGAVTKKTFPRVITTHNHVGVVGNIDRVNYIHGREILTTASVGSTTAIIQREAETGFVLYALPNIGLNDAIVKLSTSQSALLDLDTKGEGDQLVESPIINDKLFNTTIKVEYGKALLIAGLSDTLLQTASADSGVLPLGVSRSSKERTSETILMIEVVRL